MDNLPVVLSVGAGADHVPVDEIEACRLLVVLHPNTSCLSIILSDRKFNNERYAHTRDAQADGAEKALLDYIEFNIFGIDRVVASKNKLSIQLEDGTRPRDVIPQIVTAIKEWGSTIEPYTPAIFCMDERWEELPRDNEWGSYGGRHFEPGAAVLGIPYRPWSNL